MTEPAIAHVAPETTAPARPPAEAAPATSVARNAVHLIAGQATLTALSFVLSGALGRILGPADFGLYFFLTATTGFAFTFVDWGQSHVLVREMARHRARTGELLGTALAIRGALSVIAVPVTAVALWALGHEARIILLALLSVVLTVPTTMWVTYGMAFRAHERMDADAKVGVVNKVLSLALALPVLALGGRLIAVLVALGAASVAALGYATRVAARIRFPPLRLDAAEARELLVLGTPLVLMNLLSMGQSYLEPLLLSLMAPEDVLGWYGAGRTIANALVMPAQIIASASFPRLARSSAAPGELQREFRIAMRSVLALAVLVGIGTWAFAPVAIDLVYGGEKYAGAALVLRAIAPTLSLVFLNIVLSTTVLILGKAKAVTLFKGLVLASGAALAFWLVPLAQAKLGNGGVGAVAAFGVGEVAIMAFLLLCLPRGLLQRRLLLDTLRAVGAGAITCGLFAVSPWSNALFTIPAFVAVFAAGCVVSGLFSRSDAAALLAVFRRGRHGRHR